MLNLEYNKQSIEDFTTYFSDHHVDYQIDLKSVTAFARNSYLLYPSGSTLPHRL